VYYKQSQPSDDWKPSFAEAHAVKCRRRGCDKIATCNKPLGKNGRSMRVCDEHLIDTWNALQELIANLPEEGDE
jgi:hypothetical protein